MNLEKKEDSNQRRLESLRLQAEEFKQKKQQIRINLNNLDNAATAPANKKIIFSDNEEEAAPIQNKKFKSDPEQKNQLKKQKLIGSSDEESDTEAENAKTMKMFENKLNLNEKKANQLIQLKTKYSNEDGRFKIDDRFVDGSSSSEASSSESESESEESGDENTEKAPRKPKKLVSDESVKKKLKKETMASLDILASITGKTSRKPVDPNAEESKGEKSTAKKMVRYDPTKTEHKIFELLSDNDEYESEMTKLKNKKTKSTDEADENKANIDLAQYTKIESNLKELFTSNDLFQFKFDNIPDPKPVITEWDKPKKIVENKLQRHLNFNNNSVGESSDSENDDPSHLDYLKKSDVPKKTAQAKPTEVKPSKNSYQSTGPKRFLPLFAEDKEIKDALSYFCCAKENDELRKEWSSSREKLVEEYKKKHKRMLRIQKTKENEKVMTWRFKKKN